MSWENLIKDQSIFSLVIILIILITQSFDYVGILLRENIIDVGHYWDLKGLIIER